MWIWIAGTAVPAHRLHDVEEHGRSQIRAEVDEHGENHHCKAESLLVVFLQHGGTVPTPGTMHRETGMFKHYDDLFLDRYLFIYLSDIVVGCSSINSSGAGTNMLTVLGAESRLVFVGPTKKGVMK